MAQKSLLGRSTCKLKSLCMGLDSQLKIKTEVCSDRNSGVPVLYDYARAAVRHHGHLRPVQLPLAHDVERLRWSEGWVGSRSCQLEPLTAWQAFEMA